MKVIIYEGIDHTGKSTSIEKLKKRLKNYDMYHIDGSHDNNFKFYDDIISLAKLRDLDYLIFDRAMLGEFVYGNTYRNGSRINFRNIRLLLEKYKDVDFEINVKYVKNEDFMEYIQLLSIRDKVDIFGGLEESATIKKCEQGHFKTIIEFLKYHGFQNVTINESFFNLGGGDNE